MRRAAPGSFVRAALVGLFASALLASMLAACDDPNMEPGRHGHARCAALATCGTCTPALGCGWCGATGGGGTCVDGPDDCAPASSFTWDLAGCPDEGEGGTVATSDGGRTLADAQLGDQDGAVATPKDASNDDASDANQD
jgi:hypothetical protein